MRRGHAHRSAPALALAAFAVCLLCALAFAARARADVFGAISLASAGRLEGLENVQQAQEAQDSVISADGRYLAFDGTFAGKTGIFRRDLQTGEVAVVAEGQALLPSISREGRYISFTAAARLDEEDDTNSAPDVYVRDMAVPASAPCGPEWQQREEPCAYTLASAVNGSSEGLTYQYPSEEYAGGVAFDEKHYGALASGRSALSADGSEVAFITTAASDLNGAGQPELPRLQVMVRYLASRRTELVSTIDRDGEETSEAVPTSPDGYYGAVYPGGNSAPEFPLSSPDWGASLSADGTTVAWMGNQIAEQVPLLAAESLEPEYSEPLWRAIGQGASSPTRRITGGSDPLNPECQRSGQTSLPQHASLADPCQGPFETTGGLSGVPGLYTGSLGWNFVPQLSEDGDTVAFLATARYIAGGEEFKSAESTDDLYVANMTGGLTRVQALTRLTAVAGGSQTNGGRISPIVDLGVSPDGTQVAFATARTVFPLGSPALVSPPEATSFLDELYSADLSDETLTRVTAGYEGQRTEAAPGEDSTGSPSFSADDSLLAFSSTEDNLVYGDGNAASDAFTVERVIFRPDPAADVISGPPPVPSPEAVWALSVTSARGADGKVILYVGLPGAGSLRAVARSAVASYARAHKASVRGRRRRSRARRSGISTRTVASWSRAHAGAGLVEVPLTLAKGYRSLAEARLGLLADVVLRFSAPGHPELTDTVQVVFHRKPAKASSAPRGRKKR